jgi:hypothetical protein
LRSSYAIAYVVGPFTRLVLTGVAGTIDSYEFVIPDVFGVAAVVMGLAIFAMARRGVLSSSRLLDLGLVFQVGGALGIAVREFWAWTAAKVRRFVHGFRRMRVAPRLPARRSEHSAKDPDRIAARGVHGAGRARHICFHNWNAYHYFVRFTRSDPQRSMRLLLY